MNNLEKLKIKYDYYKTWLLTSISLFMTSSIGIFNVKNPDMVIALTVIWLISVVMYFIFYDKFHKVYSDLT
jgi:hypothetical protein